MEDNKPVEQPSPSNPPIPPIPDITVPREGESEKRSISDPEEYIVGPNIETIIR